MLDVGTLQALGPEMKRPSAELNNRGRKHYRHVKVGACHEGTNFER